MRAESKLLASAALLLILAIGGFAAWKAPPPATGLIARSLALAGNAQAQFGLGLAYETGTGVPHDDAEAMKWYRKAAEHGLAQAQFALWVAYATGMGVPEDDAEAVKWLRRAAEQGDAASENVLGWAYHRGTVVATDDAEAVKWYRKAAEQGFAQAQSNLGFAYATGLGVAKDDAEAVKWSRKAAEQGLAQAQVLLGLAYDSGTGVAKDHAEAVKWWRKAAEHGDAQAQTYLNHAESVVATGDPSDAASTVQGTEWAITQQKDNLTDELTLTASKTFQTATTHDITTAVTCNTQHNIDYLSFTFSLGKSSGEAFAILSPIEFGFFVAELQYRLDETSVRSTLGILKNATSMRLAFPTTNRLYNGDTIDDLANLIKADLLRVRLSLADGQQADLAIHIPALRQFFTQCLGHEPRPVPKSLSNSVDTYDETLRQAVRAYARPVKPNAGHE